ncbi:MAG TPA: hypothetical protein VJN92_03740 [Candidatus Acidoferrum sp.]|nr:hypothetical protein [Candidatus Acidoferrum sp.]
MRETRRDFFVSAATLSASLALSRGVLAAQNPPTPPPKPQPGYTPNPAEIHSNPVEAAAARRARLVQSEKEFRDGVERLYQLTSDLRDELEKTPTSSVFSVHIVKQTEAIERLAKRLKSQSKSA